MLSHTVVKQGLTMERDEVRILCHAITINSPLRLRVSVLTDGLYDMCDGEINDVQRAVFEEIGNDLGIDQGTRSEILDIYELERKLNQRFQKLYS